MEIQEENSRKVLKINDDTGEMKFIVYCKSQSDIPHYYVDCNPTEKMYVKVMISITNYQDKKIFICQRLDEIKNFNEFVNHMIMVMHRSLARQHPNFENDEKENLGTTMKNVKLLKNLMKL